jgi:hypothetical protein
MVVAVGTGMINSGRDHLHEVIQVFTVEDFGTASRGLTLWLDLRWALVGHGVSFSVCEWRF